MWSLNVSVIVPTHKDCGRETVTFLSWNNLLRRWKLERFCTPTFSWTQFILFSWISWLRYSVSFSSILDLPPTISSLVCIFQKLKNRTSDLTRGTVQKSVCVLSLLPLYGHIQVKMSLITHAYFEEGDFTKVSLLQDTYHHLNSCLLQVENLYESPQLYVGKLDLYTLVSYLIYLKNFIFAVQQEKFQRKECCSFIVYIILAN